MLAARFGLIDGQFTKKSFITHSHRKQRFIPVILLGDSMVGYLKGQTDHTEVVSIGGARLQDFSYEFLYHHISRACPFLVLLHIETNDVNKSMLPVHQAMRHASSKGNNSKRMQPRVTVPPLCIPSHPP